MPTAIRAQCRAVGSCLPQQVLDNAMLERMVDTSDEWIRTRTGIRERRMVADGEYLSDLAVASCRQCLQRAGLEAEAVDGIIVATSTGDFSMPAVANVVQHRLAATRAWGYDLVNACNGFVSGIATASALIEAGRCQRILLVAGDVMTPYIDFQDRNTCILFGDGCGAVLLEAGPGDGPGVIDWLMGSDGAGADLLKIPCSGSAIRPSPAALDRGDHFLKQEGRQVYNYAIRHMTESCQQLLQRNGLGIGDVDLLIPHQANQRIMTNVAERLQSRPEQLVSNIDRYGNTTAGTIPLAMADALDDGRLVAGSRVLVTAFGAGFSWGSVYLTWGGSST
ncbi:MAG: ketoacyl-ACP synthase III [Planctomycetota bacterium]|nr:MAG: ketoacyl-ACP synthase III [Planctomycetota bacterium]